MIELLSKLNHARLRRRGLHWLKQAEARAPLWLDLADYADREVAIIGPASGVAQELAAQPLRQGTVIVRMNRSAALALQDPVAHGGSRTDLLFHMLKTDGERGTGPIDREALARAGVRHLVYPHALPRKIKRRVIDTHAQFAHDTLPDLRLPPLDVYADLDRDFTPLTPTTGATAIATMLAAKPRVLGIYGFSFFQTGYAPGYNDAISDGAAAQDWARESNIHDPDAEAHLMARRLTDYRAQGHALRLGSGVATALGLAQ